MIQPEDELIKLISEKVIEKWTTKNEPYLLSSVGSDYRGDVTLKKTLNGKRLKEWVELNLDKLSADILTHPTQKEKIGLIPKGENYEYNTQTPSKIRKTSAATKNLTKKEITIAFISILGELTEEEADKITIPTSLLSKLLGD